MAPKTPVAEPLPGYLYVTPRGSYAGTEQPIALMAACPCGRWHRHGAGTVQTPHAYRPGSIASRVSHCTVYDYRQVRVEAEPFRSAWATPAGRISAAYLRWLPPTRPGAAGVAAREGYV